jgi:hypothetical protein
MISCGTMIDVGWNPGYETLLYGAMYLSVVNIKRCYKIYSPKFVEIYSILLLMCTAAMAVKRRAST